MKRIKISITQAVWIASAGTILGIIAAVLTKLGNPLDGGITVSCFERDIAGALGLHQMLTLSYIRPEIIGIVLGAFLVSFFKGSFRPVGGSSTILRFFISVLVTFGLFVFIGCPLRLCLRLGGGDPAALPALLGLITGVWLGTLFLKKGFTLGRECETTKSNGIAFHFFILFLLILLFLRPDFIVMSKEGYAPLFISLLAGTLIGILGQRTKLCFVSGFRNFILIKDVSLLVGFFFVIISVFIANLLLGQSHMGIHIIGSSDLFWNFMSMLLVGFGSIMLGGCPFRQLILASQGNTDSAVSVFGIIIGSAISHNFFLAYIAGSVNVNGKIAVVLGIFVLVIIGFLNRGRDDIS